MSSEKIIPPSIIILNYILSVDQQIDLESDSFKSWTSSFRWTDTGNVAILSAPGQQVKPYYVFPEVKNSYFNPVDQRKYDNCNPYVRRHYKFHLAFENNICKDYVTEKFFLSLMENVSLN